MRVCGKWAMKFWENSNDLVSVRWYRVPDGTPALPFAHRFMHSSWDAGMFRPKQFGMQGRDFLVQPGEQGLAVGELADRLAYDAGALQVGWRPPTKWIGNRRQWVEGSTVGVDQPLVWRGGWSSACKTPDVPPVGMACATGCPVCPRISPVWIVATPDFAGFSQCAIVKREGCEFTSACAPAPGCPTGTAAAWQVVVDPFGGLTGGVVAIRPNGTWSTCCNGD